MLVLPFLRYGICPCRSPFGYFIATSNSAFNTEKAAAERQPLLSLFRLCQTKLVSRILDICLCCLFCDTGYARVARLSALLSPQAIPHSIRKKRPPNGNRFFHCFVYVKLNQFLGFLMFACAAARRAIGTLNGEQET